jgi:hypothetical protein
MRLLRKVIPSPFLRVLKSGRFQQNFFKDSLRGVHISDKSKLQNFYFNNTLLRTSILNYWGYNMDVISILS